ncbi:hypothetical protein GGF31_000162 [Allomyces arbusculus]|nr:hypothetical protein GGF31_000162 [Allomyces arbusculus]
MATPTGVLAKPHPDDSVWADSTVSEPAFFWSASCFFFALGIYLHFSAILFAIELWWTKSRWFYLALVGVAISHLGDLFITNIGNMADVQYRWMLQIMAVLDWLFIWSGFTGFALLNGYRCVVLLNAIRIVSARNPYENNAENSRLHAMCEQSRPRLVKSILFLIAVQIALWTCIAVTSIVAFYSPSSSDLVQHAVEYISSAYLFDAIASVITSMAFLYHLQSLHPAPMSFKIMSTLRASFLSSRASQSEPPSSPIEAKTGNSRGRIMSSPSSTDAGHDGPVLYSSMHVLLRRSQALLLFECSAMLTGILVQVAAEGTDPLWFMLFVAEPFWTWSSSCFFFTLAVYLHLSSIALASQLWWTKTRGWYFLGMVIVALSHLVDLMVTNITSSEYYTAPRVTRRILAAVDWLAIWVGFVGFALLNWHRIRAMCRISRPRLTCAVSVLVAMQCLLWTGVIATVLTAFYWPDRSSPIIQHSTYYIFPAFFWDALVNIFTSSAFIFHLYKLHPPPPRATARPGMTVRFLGSFKSSESLRKSSTSLANSSNSDAPATLYAHMHKLLHRSQILLLLECATMFTAALLPLTVPDVDPLNVLIFFAEAVTLRDRRRVRREGPGAGRGQIEAVVLPRVQV